MNKEHKVFAIIGHQFMSTALIALENKFKEVVKLEEEHTFLIPEENITVIFAASLTDVNIINADHILDCNDFLAPRNMSSIPIVSFENTFRYESPIIEKTHTGKWFDNIPKNKPRNRHWK